MRQSNKYIVEIEELSIMLMGIIERLVHKKKEGLMINQQRFESFDGFISAESSFKMGDVIRCDKTQFNQIFQINRGFDEKNIEIIAEIILAISEIAEPPFNAFLVTKAWEVYKYLDTKSRFFSKKYEMKIKNLENILDAIKTKAYI